MKTLKVLTASRASMKALLAVLIALIIFYSNFAKAESIGLTKTPGADDITTSYDVIDYDGAGTFTATGSSFTAVLNNEHYIITDTDNNVFTINMQVDPLTGVPISGSLNIAGYFDDGYKGIDSDQSMLIGDIAQLGYFGVGPEAELEFIFNVMSGSLQSEGVFPTQVGILLHQSQFQGDWQTSFSTGSAYSDTFALPVPEPSCFILLSSLFVSCWLVYRRQHASGNIR